MSQAELENRTVELEKENSKLKTNVENLKATIQDLRNERDRLLQSNVDLETFIHDMYTRKQNNSIIRTVDGLG